MSANNYKTESDSSTDFYFFEEPISPNKLNKILGNRSTSPSVQFRQATFKMTTKNSKNIPTMTEQDMMDIITKTNKEANESDMDIEKSKIIMPSPSLPPHGTTSQPKGKGSGQTDENFPAIKEMVNKLVPFNPVEYLNNLSDEDEEMEHPPLASEFKTNMVEHHIFKALTLIMLVVNLFNQVIKCIRNSKPNN